MAFCLFIGALLALCSVTFAADAHAAAAPKQCYSCSTTSLDRLLNFHMTPIWRTHMLDTLLVNISEHCRIMHTHEEILASGVKPIPCVDGICAEMSAKEQNEMKWMYQENMLGSSGVCRTRDRGTLHVWRGCLRNPKDAIAANCDHALGDDGTHWQACACEGSLCNGASRTTIGYLFAVIISISFALLFSH